jgi:hypothetical protein
MLTQLVYANKAVYANEHKVKTMADVLGSLDEALIKLRPAMTILVLTVLAFVAYDYFQKSGTLENRWMQFAGSNFCIPRDWSATIYTPTGSLYYDGQTRIISITKSIKTSGEIKASSQGVMFSCTNLSKFSACTCQETYEEFCTLAEGENVTNKGMIFNIIE